MNTEILITPTIAKSLVPEINNDISDILVTNAIKMTQQSVIKPTLGEEWLNQLLTQKSGGTYSTANKYIMDNYIQWILSYATWQYLVVTLSLQLNSSGLRIKQSDHSVQSESKDIAFYRTYIQDFIDTTRKDMKRYIDLHKSDFPLYYNNIYHDKPSENVFNFKVGSV
jgi:hypothetical protein